MRIWLYLKAFWALWWRMLLLTPIVWILGLILFTVVLGLTFLPAVTVALIIYGEYWWALATVAVFLAWLRWGGPVRRFVFEGFEYAGL